MVEPVALDFNVSGVFITTEPVPDMVICPIPPCLNVNIPPNGTATFSGTVTVCPEDDEILMYVPTPDNANVYPTSVNVVTTIKPGCDHCAAVSPALTSRILRALPVKLGKLPINTV